MPVLMKERSIFKFTGKENDKVFKIRVEKLETLDLLFPSPHGNVFIKCLYTSFTQASYTKYLNLQKQYMRLFHFFEITEIY